MNQRNRTTNMFHIRMGFLRLAAILLAAVGLNSSSGLQAAHKYAVLVGVQAYEHPSLRQPPLKYACRDVAELAVVLGQSDYEVVLLTDETGKKDSALVPTRANIESKIQDTLRKCKSDDTIVIAFAGHGLQFTGKDAYFCPQDARPFPDETDSLVSISGIYRELEKSFAGVKIILVDACRNDPDPGRGRSGLDANAAPPPPRGVGALFSCSAGQKAYEHDELEHGVFFYHVLAGLRGQAADRQGEITFDSLSTYVRNEVPREMARLFKMHKQFPNLKADLVGVPPVLVAATRRKAGDIRSDNVLGMKMVWCPPGRFKMGSPPDEEGRDDNEDQVEVTLTRGFWLGQTEVTQGQWKQVMGTEPWKGEEYVKEGSGNAASYISWEDAMEFCRRLTEQERRAGRLGSDEEYTLPTEAQWEYACRAETTTRFHFGDDETQLSDYAWWGGLLGNGNAQNEQYAHAVGQKRANAWNLYDMHGNVFELCRDWYDEELSGGRDPEVTAGGSYRVNRGGGWFYTPRFCRSADRRRCSPDLRYYSLGFRVAFSSRW